MPSLISARYAQAMVDVVLAPGSSLDSKDVLEKLGMFEDAIAASPDLRKILASPAVRASKKRAVVGRIAAALALPRQVANLLFVLIDRKRIGELHDVVEAMDAEFDRRTGAVSAEVRSPFELGPEQRQTLEKQLTLLSGKKARLKFVQDSSLIGGVIAKVGSTVYDGSVRGELEQLKRRLTAGA